MHIYVCTYTYIERDKEKERALAKPKALKHLCYEIPNFTFNDK